MKRYLACHECGERLFLIRGLCTNCAPELHEDYERKVKEIREAEEHFYSLTGASALNNWYEFEKFYEGFTDL